MTPALEALKATIEEALLRFLPHRSAIAPQLIEAMRYAALTGGKRLRPMLTCAACSAFGGDLRNALAPASAVEFVHAYSLAHDDLPAMDDDDWRRGAPSCHAKYGEATAILAGDALLTLAFEVLAKADAASAEVRATALGILAEACGWSGMVGGQAYDLASVGQAQDLGRFASHARRQDRRAVQRRDAPRRPIRRRQGGRHGLGGRLRGPHRPSLSDHRRYTRCHRRQRRVGQARRGRRPGRQAHLRLLAGRG